MIGDKITTLKDGRKLSYIEYGDPKGKVLIYLHGWPSGRLMARETDQAAKKLGIRVISPDRPGYGLSDYKPKRALLDYPDDLLELADRLKIKKFAVVGVSGGGPYAAVCAYKISDRLTKVGIVVGLAPTYVPGLLEGMSMLNKISWSSYPYSGWVRNFAAWLAYFRNKYLPSFNSWSFPAKQDRQLMTSEFRKNMHQALAEAFRQGTKGAAWDLKLYTQDWGFDLKRIKAPVFLWYGAEDKNVGVVMGKYFASQIKGSKLTIYQNEGHFCRVNHEEEILKTLLS